MYQAPRESRAHSDHTAQLDHPETLAPLYALSCHSGTTTDYSVCRDLQDQLAKSGPKAHVEKRYMPFEFKSSKTDSLRQE